MRVGGPQFAAGQRSGHAERETHDFYPTHWGATAALCHAEQFAGPIWEPACGDGALSDELIRQGHTVISTDLIDRGYGEGGRDFLMEWQPLAPNIVTNPPFRWAEEFIDRALLLTAGDTYPAPPVPPPGYDCGYWPGPRKVALLLRLAFLEGQERCRRFAEWPLARVHVMSARIPFAKGERAATEDKGGPLAFAWFVFEHGHSGPPTLSFLDWKVICQARLNGVKA